MFPKHGMVLKMKNGEVFLTFKKETDDFSIFIASLETFEILYECLSEYDFNEFLDNYDCGEVIEEISFEQYMAQKK